MSLVTSVLLDLTTAQEVTDSVGPSRCQGTWFAAAVQVVPQAALKGCGSAGFLMGLQVDRQSSGGLLSSADGALEGLPGLLESGSGPTPHRDGAFRSAGSF